MFSIFMLALIRAAKCLYTHIPLMKFVLLFQTQIYILLRAISYKFVARTCLDWWQCQMSKPFYSSNKNLWNDKMFIFLQRTLTNICYNVVHTAAKWEFNQLYWSVISPTNCWFGSNWDKIWINTCLKTTPRFTQSN